MQVDLSFGSWFEIRSGLVIKEDEELLTTNTAAIFERPNVLPSDIWQFAGGDLSDLFDRMNEALSELDPFQDNTDGIFKPIAVLLPSCEVDAADIDGGRLAMSDFDEFLASLDPAVRTAIAEYMVPLNERHATFIDKIVYSDPDVVSVTWLSIDEWKGCGVSIPYEPDKSAILSPVFFIAPYCVPWGDELTGADGDQFDGAYPQATAAAYHAFLGYVLMNSAIIPFEIYDDHDAGVQNLLVRYRKTEVIYDSLG